MPIANVYVSSEAIQSASALAGLTDLWSSRADIDAQHMTVNLIGVDAQVGRAYAVMAFLFLPTLWSDEQVARLQAGLSQALSRAFSVGEESIRIVTLSVESGRTVSDGAIETW